jgi:predicted ABC-class ATPase
MALKEGVTIITGGGFHGKSTLLNAIEKAIYNHISGDGREFCITNTDAVKIRAEDGRSVNKVDISSFIGNLPYGKDTKSFSTENASGSTSQASNIVEAIELGSKLLLIDEDTSATNFMVRDKKVQELITKDKEPITPFISKVSALYKKNRVSSIVVVGGLGDFFDVANKVLMLDNYKVLDITKRAKEIALKYKDEELTYSNSKVDVKNRRLNVSETIKVFNTKKVKLKNKDLDELIIGKDEINLRSVEQLVEFGQVNFIGELIRKIFTRRDLDKYTLRDILETYENRLKDESIEEMIGSKSGKLVYTRKYEVGAAINRIRKDLFI